MTEIPSQGSVGSRPRRVLCVLRWPVGGIRTYILYNYPYLLDNGFRFTFLGPRDESFQSFREDVRGWDNVECVEAPVNDRRYCRMWPLVRRQLRTGRFALVHAQGYKSAFESLIGGIGVSIPQIVTVHDVLRPAEVGGLSGGLKLSVLGLAIRRADALICVTQDVKDNVLTYWPFLRRFRGELVTIPHGIDLGRLIPGDDAASVNADLRGRLGLGSDVFLMGFLGRFMEQKGFLPLLDALELLRRDPPDRPFHLVAVGSGDFVREYGREADRRGLRDVLSFQDAVSNAAPILRQLDLLVMPSLWEAAGLLAMEAMALGVPVLGSDCIGLREVLRDTPSVTFPTGDIQSLSRSLKRAVSAPWSQEAKLFAPMAQDRFNKDRSSQALLGVFRRYSS